MSVRTPTPPTEEAVCTLTFCGPPGRAAAARTALAALGFEETDTLDSLPWRQVLPAIPDAERPGRTLKAARGKAGLSQAGLAAMIGVPQRHISEMEHGKRPIGKARAKQLATALQVDYHVLL